MRYNAVPRGLARFETWARIAPLERVHYDQAFGELMSMIRNAARNLRRIFVPTFISIISIAALAGEKPSASNASWKFAVSGDSRNCGDIVMPAIAAGVRASGAEFYWHLGDYRAMSNFDEDYRKTHPQASITRYYADAWPDFIQHQLVPFGDLPVFLAIGNHELVKPMTRRRYIAQFADWLDQPILHQQRLADDPSDHELKTYTHWIERGVDFISMDNASAEMFDAAQMSWFKMVLANDAKNDAVKTVVLGMHAALPDSSSAGHSMNDSAQQQLTGRKVYAQLSAFRKATGKKVYVLASHSHFVMSNVYNTACHKDDVLDGWIMGSAGAIRYRLPLNLDQSRIAMTDIYGYLLATVAPDGTMTFQFKDIKESDVPPPVVNEFSRELVDWCFVQNKSNYTPAGPTCSTAPLVDANH